MPSTTSCRGDQRGQVGVRHPVDHLRAGAIGGARVEQLLVLAGADDREVDRRIAHQAHRLGHRRRALQRHEGAEEQHLQPVAAAIACGARAKWSGSAPTGTIASFFARDAEPVDEERPMLRGVDQRAPALAGREAVEQPAELRLDAVRRHGLPVVGDRVVDRQHQVEHDLVAPGQQARQEDVEVPEVPDQHDVVRRCGAVGAGEPHPGPRDPHQRADRERVAGQRDLLVVLPCQAGSCTSITSAPAARSASSRFATRGMQRPVVGAEEAHADGQRASSAGGARRGGRSRGRCRPRWRRGRSAARRPSMMPAMRRRRPRRPRRRGGAAGSGRRAIRSCCRTRTAWPARHTRGRDQRAERGARHAVRARQRILDHHLQAERGGRHDHGRMRPAGARHQRRQRVGEGEAAERGGEQLERGRRALVRAAERQVEQRGSGRPPSRPRAGARR